MCITSTKSHGLNNHIQEARVSELRTVIPYARTTQRKQTDILKTVRQ